MIKKRLINYFFPLLILSTFSCKDQEPNPVRSFSYRFDTTITVPQADSGTYQDTAFMADLSALPDKALANRSLGTKDIKDLNLDSTIMSHNQPKGFNWLDSISLSFDASSLDRELIAEKQQVPIDSLTRLRLNSKTTNLAPYLKTPAFYLLVSTQHRALVKDSISIFLELYFTFRYEDD